MVGTAGIISDSQLKWGENCYRATIIPMFGAFNGASEESGVDQMQNKLRVDGSTSLSGEALTLRLGR
jgi:hypothetical protein